MTDSTASAPSALGVIAVTGADAADFLRAQLTNDVMRLGHRVAVRMGLLFRTLIGHLRHVLEGGSVGGRHRTRTPSHSQAKPTPMFARWNLPRRRP